MTKENITTGLNITRARMIQLLNEDLAGEYQAIIAYTVYSQVLKGAAYTDIARELEVHAGEELAHAIKIAKQIDYQRQGSGRKQRGTVGTKQLLQLAASTPGGRKACEPDPIHQARRE